MEFENLLICSIVIVAYTRLGTYLAARITTHLHIEEGRYQQLRRKNGRPNPERKFFFFFQFQAVSNVLLAIPFFIIAMNPTPHLYTLEYAGAALYGL